MDAKVDELAFLDLLRQRDETAFTQLVEQHHSSLVRLATVCVQDTTTAEEVVQETWLAVLHGLDRFEGRSSRTL
jgi:RNA polymerase sigma-70 factor, ECF subfamily